LSEIAAKGGHKQGIEERMNILDIIIIAIVALFILRGLWKGLVRQIIGIAGAVVAVIVAIKFSGVMAAKFLTGFQPSTGYIIMFLAILVACMIAASLIAALIGKLTSAVGLGIPNRIAGGILGGLKGYFLMAAIVLILIAFLPPKNHILTGSSTLKYVRPMSDMMNNFAPNAIASRFKANIGRPKPGQQEKNKLWM
jgi:membrane protein required for colicin V production